MLIGEYGRTRKNVTHDLFRNIDDKTYLKIRKLAIVENIRPPFPKFPFSKVEFNFFSTSS